MMVHFRYLMTFRQLRHANHGTLDQVCDHGGTVVILGWWVGGLGVGRDVGEHAGALLVWLVAPGIPRGFHVSVRRARRTTPKVGTAWTLISAEVFTETPHCFGVFRLTGRGFRIGAP